MRKGFFLNHYNNIMHAFYLTGIYNGFVLLSVLASQIFTERQVLGPTLNKENITFMNWHHGIILRLY